MSEGTVWYFQHVQGNYNGAIRFLSMFLNYCSDFELLQLGRSQCQCTLQTSGSLLEGNTMFIVSKQIINNLILLDSNFVFNSSDKEVNDNVHLSLRGRAE